MASAFPTSVDNETALVDGTDKMRASTSINLAFLDITSTQTMIGASGAAQTHNTDILTQLANFKAPQLKYNGTNNFDVLAGSIVTQNAGGSIKKLRRNTSTVNVTASDLDTGSMAVGYYYVYAIGDATATTFTVKFSATANAAPSGTTHYCMIGWFYNETGGVLDVTSKFLGNIKDNGRDVPNSIILSSTSTDTVNDTSYGSDLTGTTARFYSSGRPVFITAGCELVAGGANTSIIVDIDGTDKTASQKTSDFNTTDVEDASVHTQWLEVLSAGTHTITIQAKVGASSTDITNKVLIIMEL